MARCPAPAGRHTFDVADIVRQHRHSLEAAQVLTAEQRRVLTDIQQCRTAVLGGHLEVCRSCGYNHQHYHSCRNRHCPKCQALAQQRWIAARTERLLPVQHFHVVFTLPSELRALVKYRPGEIFNALFVSASATLSELGCSRLKAQLGITMVLHTWTRDLRFHPHLHAIVTAGGLALDGSHWVARTKYLFPIRVMGALLCGKMMAALRRMHRDGLFKGFAQFSDPQGFDHLMTRLAAQPWVVYAKQPFSSADFVIAYLGRYTHRVGIANSRFVAISDQHVTFRTKNGLTTTLSPVGFLRRLVQHVLPNHFHKIRHAGLYSSTHAREGSRLDQARALIATPNPSTGTEPTESDVTAQLAKVLGRDPSRCPRCHGPLEIHPISRGPPWSLAS